MTEEMAMATIELDIIKQRCDKLPAAEKLDLINYLAASLAPEETGLSSKVVELEKSMNDDPKKS